MPKFTVTAYMDASCTKTIEADTEDAAVVEMEHLIYTGEINDADFQPCGEIDEINADEEING